MWTDKDEDKLNQLNELVTKLKRKRNDEKVMDQVEMLRDLADKVEDGTYNLHIFRAKYGTNGLVEEFRPDMYSGSMGIEFV